MPCSRFAAYSRPPNLVCQKVRYGKMNLKVLEWFGVITAIAYSLFVASNVGLEFVGFVLLFISAISIGAWAYLGGHRGILLLQLFYAVAGLIGMVRWF